jgi:hypothetical protein
MSLNLSEIDEVWYHGYHVVWTRGEEKGGGDTMSRPTRPKDPGQEVNY